MLEMKLTHFPSAEKLGDVALPTRAIRATDAARSVFSFAWGRPCADKVAHMQQTEIAKTVVLRGM